jgi:50S ribosomal subunit-associated GTPase HflX
MTESERLYIMSTATELVSEIGSLYTEGDGERGSPYGEYQLPRELHKYNKRIARIYNLAENLKSDLEDKL